jgi:hypothetical protein
MASYAECDFSGAKLAKVKFEQCALATAVLRVLAPLPGRCACTVARVTSAYGQDPPGVAVMLFQREMISAGTMCTMKTLLSERFAPTTSSVGYLRLPLGDAVEALAGWRRSLVDGSVSVEEAGEFPECLRRLEPLTGGARPRELLVEASDTWTAYFDCSLRGTDAVSTVGFLSEQAGCQGLAIRAVPHTLGKPGAGEGRYGSVQFEMFGPLRTGFLNYVRTVSASHDGSRWVFTVSGIEQWFEEPDAYRARRVRDRFTSEMLERYCKALGLDVFDSLRYGPRSMLVRSDVPVPSEGHVMSMEQVQRWLGIMPGMADSLPG